MLKLLGSNWEAKSGEGLKHLDNFLEANLEAQMVQDEIKIDRELKNVPEAEFENLLNETLYPPLRTRIVIGNKKKIGVIRVKPQTMKIM